MAVTTTAVLNRPACPVTTTPPGRHPLTNAVGTTLAPGDFTAGYRPVRHRNEDEAPEAQTLRSAATSSPRPGAERTGPRSALCEGHC
ncbi:hypothetical protein Slala02_58070 [Streptomyces lavendulae subsp. lavendulae]|nr:hypothetical protein Slala01_61480 [Streptomyces lavendulae subsp. lavendulae]GLX29987.1 hypothetical protein Slala02_58070 [Streptomyces lavendulae subsp. lavendulae]